MQYLLQLKNEIKRIIILSLFYAPCFPLLLWRTERWLLAGILANEVRLERMCLETQRRVECLATVVAEVPSGL